MEKINVFMDLKLDFDKIRQNLPQRYTANRGNYTYEVKEQDGKRISSKITNNKTGASKEIYYEHTPDGVKTNYTYKYRGANYSDHELHLTRKGKSKAMLSYFSGNQASYLRQNGLTLSEDYIQLMNKAIAEKSAVAARIKPSPAFKMSVKEEKFLWPIIKDTLAKWAKLIK